MNPHEDHRRFLNRYYGQVRHLYDVTRKYYLFGRDTALRQLCEEPWERLVEIGPGTGRNLRKLHAMRPNARLGGLEASDVMLAHARARCPWATLEQGFIDADQVKLELLGAPPDRILFSYCLSMVQDPIKALHNARRALAPGGSIVVVDFADGAGLPRALRDGFGRFLRSFHVTPLDEGLFGRSAVVRYGAVRYYLLAFERNSPLESTPDAAYTPQHG
jgi:S-adenosylmethionine-diacylgycerolhomoserine-N-methlytransferase